MQEGQPGTRAHSKNTDVFLMYHHAVRSTEWNRGAHAESTIVEVTEPKVLQSHYLILVLLMMLLPHFF